MKWAVRYGGAFFLLAGRWKDVKEKGRYTTFIYYYYFSLLAQRKDKHGDFLPVGSALQISSCVKNGLTGAQNTDFSQQKTCALEKHHCLIL